MAVAYQPIAPFYKSNRVKATYLTGRKSRLIVSFTGVGKPDTKQQDEEFIGYGHQGGRNHVLFVADTLRSWYNDPGIFEEICDLVDDYRHTHSIEETVTFGNSMGGYGAVIFAKALKAKSCLSLAAQYSADPEAVPEELRWKEYRNRITLFTRPPIKECLDPECRYFILHGAQEQIHWSRFPKAPFLYHYLVPRTGHGVGRKLKSSGLIYPATRYAIAGRPRAFRLALEEPMQLLRPWQQDGSPIVT